MVPIFLESSCIPPHRNGIAKSGAFKLKRRFNAKIRTKNWQPNKTIAGKIYQNKTIGVKVPM